MGCRIQDPTPPPPYASTALSMHGVGVELPFLGIFGTTVFVVPDVTWGLKTVYHTLPPDDVCFDMILSHSCSFPSTACRHLHLRDLLDVGDHVCLPSCVPHAGTVLSKHGVGVEPLFCLLFFGTVAVLAQGGDGVGPMATSGGKQPAFRTARAQHRHSAHTAPGAPPDCVIKPKSLRTKLRGRSGVRNICHVAHICTHIWIPQEILSILRKQTWCKN